MLTCVHGLEHACDKLKDSIGLFNQGNQGRDLAFIIAAALEALEH